MIESIREKIEIDLFEFSKHAVDQSIIRHIRVKDVRTVIANGIIIENYPEDKYGPSCLIFGMTAERRPIHIQCSHPSRPIIKIITLYEPNPTHWIDFKKRRLR
jgi:hypothetical protein